MKDGPRAGPRLKEKSKKMAVRYESVIPSVKMALAAKKRVNVTVKRVGVVLLVKYQTATVAIMVIVMNLMSVFVTTTGKVILAKLALMTGREQTVTKKNHNVKTVIVQVMVNV